ncbi:PREDICTED: uncharacterized protein LOC109585303 isoform X2 [Amphimedon queenslandica]|uniref:Ig-like domain-containing protein n=1 Tax=Amphimedon queenslandica TaxID=400682 RepID=A0AAN0JJM2_AMPQE|nr:PREDICTED: uncharacterized protein LOC109585303 isoform X2 [Amphimedon queenslandica]|eukprot:XP_019856873.1 PREDICTED: uncharacterized protein LOC109585303 isoform X2 [Amphimedon queenslandica]
MSASTGREMRFLSSLLFAYCLCLSFVSSQVTLLPNDTVSVCEGEIQAITCNVTGSVLIWDDGNNSTSFSSGNTIPAELGPFHLVLLSHNNGTVVSVATVNVSTSINESTLECRNTGFKNSSIRQQISFNVKHTIPISYLHVNAVSSDTLLIIWTGADCIQSYDVFINGTNVNTTSGMSLLYNTGGAIGSIDVLVNSVDYYGRAVGNLSTQYQFNTHDFEVKAIVCNNTSIIIAIKDNYINHRPVPLSCKLIVSNLTQSSSSMDCLYERLFIFTNVTEGDVYNYTVTITNVIGSAVKNGSIVLPVQVCPSQAPNFYSTLMMSQQSLCLSDTSTSTSTTTSNRPGGSNCVLPWIFGVVAGTVVVSLFI